MKKKRGTGDAPVIVAPDGIEPVSAMSALSTFKTPKQRHVGKSARYGVADLRPTPPDSNPWKMLLDARRGYEYAVGVLARVLGVFRWAGSQPEEGSNAEPLSNRALVLLFKGKHENSYRVAKGRMGTPAFRITEDRGILLLSGRHYDRGPDKGPSVIRPDRPDLMMLPLQLSSYCAPLLNPETSLGQSVMQSCHDFCHGKSGASSDAQASRYWHFASGSSHAYFKEQAAACMTCRHILQRRGQNVISPLRSIHETDLVEGVNLMIDVAGPFNVLSNGYKMQMLSFDPRIIPNSGRERNCT